MKRVMVNFTDEQWAILDDFKGIMGNTNSEIVRGVVLAYLSEKTYLKHTMNHRLGHGRETSSKRNARDLAQTRRGE